MPLVASPIVDLESEVKPFLNIDKPDFDAKLTTFIASESQAIVNDIGQVTGDPTVSEWHDGGTERIVLRNPGPIQSVTSVTESYGTITYTLSQVTLDTSSTGNAYTYTVDLDEGLIVRRAAGIAVNFADGVRNVHVTYVAGYDTVPGDIKEACLLRIKYAWETQRGTSTRNSSGPTSDAVLARAEEILKRYRVPGIA